MRNSSERIEERARGWPAKWLTARAKLYAPALAASRVSKPQKVRARGNLSRNTASKVLKVVSIARRRRLNQRRHRRPCSRLVAGRGPQAARWHPDRLASAGARRRHADPDRPGSDQRRVGRRAIVRALGHVARGVRHRGDGWGRAHSPGRRRSAAAAPGRWRHVNSASASQCSSVLAGPTTQPLRNPDLSTAASTLTP